jgi:hypothetical protein
MSEMTLDIAIFTISLNFLFIQNSISLYRQRKLSKNNKQNEEY